MLDVPVLGFTIRFPALEVVANKLEFRIPRSVKKLLLFKNVQR